MKKLLTLVTISMVLAIGCGKKDDQPAPPPGPAYGSQCTPGLIYTQEGCLGLGSCPQTPTRQAWSPTSNRCLPEMPNYGGGYPGTPGYPGYPGQPSTSAFRFRGWISIYKGSIYDSFKNEIICRSFGATWCWGVGGQNDTLDIEAPNATPFRGETINVTISSSDMSGWYSTPYRIQIPMRALPSDNGSFALQSGDYGYLVIRAFRNDGPATFSSNWFNADLEYKGQPLGTADMDRQAY